LEKSGHKTPFSREASSSAWEPRCYQVKKEGYHDSRIVCRDKEKSRYINFYLDPLMPPTPPEPQAVVPDRMSAEEKEMKPEQVMPEKEPVSIKETSREIHAPQVEKDSKIAPKPHRSKTPKVSSKPKPKLSKEQEVRPKPKAPQKEYVISASRLTLMWDDASSDEAGFEIERKEGEKGLYQKIGHVGANVTEYTDTGLKPGTVYYYRVRAYNAERRYSAYTVEIRVKTTP
jgi:hypothetical protein